MVSHTGRTMCTIFQWATHLEWSAEQETLEGAGRGLSERFHRRENVPPNRRLFCRLNLRQIQNKRCARPPQLVGIVDDVQDDVDDRCREPTAISATDMAI